MGKNYQAKKQDWTPRVEVSPATANQAIYWQFLKARLVEDSQIICCAGSAGTGKTWLACARAAQLYLEKEVDKIILTRAMVETGGSNKIGALPGEKEEKFDPWVENMKVMLGEFIGHNRVASDFGKSIIAEPLAFCRGKTFDNAFVIVDEAQNLNWDETKMITTRIGKWSKMVLAGDTKQVDLPPRIPSGFIHFLKEVERQSKPIGVVEFTPADNQRSGTSRMVTEMFDNALPII